MPGTVGILVSLIVYVADVLGHAYLHILGVCVWSIIFLGRTVAKLSVNMLCIDVLIYLCLYFLSQLGARCSAEDLIRIGINRTIRA
jgi:hypothetical protein